MRKIGLLLALGLLLPGAASANDDGYVCKITAIPAGFSPSLGNYGAITVQLNSGPNCAGTIVASKYFCTSGHSNGVCASGITRSEAGLNRLAESLQRSMESGASVSMQPGTCNNGTAGCPTIVNSWSTP